MNLISLNKLYNQRLNFLIYKRGINQELHDWNTCSVTQLCPYLCYPMDWNRPDFPVFTISWSLLKLMSIESVMPFNHLILCPPSPPALNLSQNQDLSQWSFPSLHQVFKVLELRLQYQCFRWIFRVDFFWDWPLWSPYSPKVTQEFTPAPQFKVSVPQGLDFFMDRLSHPCMKNDSFEYMELCW